MGRRDGLLVFPAALGDLRRFCAVHTLGLAIPLVAVLRLATGQQLFEGQATAITVVLLLGSAQFFFFFVLGQYVARIYDEVRGRPLYIVADTFGYEDEDKPQRHRIQMAQPSDPNAAAS